MADADADCDGASYADAHRDQRADRNRDAAANSHPVADGYANTNVFSNINAATN